MLAEKGEVVVGTGGIVVVGGPAGAAECGELPSSAALGREGAGPGRGEAGSGSGETEREVLWSEAPRGEAEAVVGVPERWTEGE
jgi:hypothetical protein